MPPLTMTDEPAPFFEWRDEWTLEVGFMDRDLAACLKNPPEHQERSLS